MTENIMFILGLALMILNILIIINAKRQKDKIKKVKKLNIFKLDIFNNLFRLLLGTIRYYKVIMDNL